MKFIYSSSNKMIRYLWMMIIIAGSLSLIGCSSGSSPVSNVVSKISSGGGDGLEGGVTTTTPTPRPVSTLVEKASKIQTWFAIPETGSAVSGLAERAANEIVVIYNFGMSVSLINTNRNLIDTNNLLVLTVPGLGTLDVSQVDPELVDPLFINDLPAPSTTQPALALRENLDHFTLSRFLADKYSMELKQEISYHDYTLAVFKTPAMVDEAALATTIQQENNDFVYAVEANAVLTSDDFHPRDGDPLLDNFATIGDGLNPVSPDNGPGTWNENEGYYYFLNNAHWSAASYFAQANAAIEQGDPGRGAGPRLFVLDSGIYDTHTELPYGGLSWPALLKPIGEADPTPAYYWDCVPASTPSDPWTYTPSPSFNEETPVAHGTHVTSVAVARGNNSFGVSGMLPQGQAAIFKIATRFDGPGGGGSNSSRLTWMADGIYRAFDVRDELGIYTANISYGGFLPAEPTILADAIDAISADPKFMLVIAAGNEDSPVMAPGQWPVYPAAFAVSRDNVLSVGGVNRFETRSVFSNFPWGVGTDGSGNPLTRGVTISAAAGGYYSAYCMADYGGGWNYGHGTSYAAPAVAAVLGELQAWLVDCDDLFVGGLNATDLREHIIECGRDRLFLSNTSLSPFITAAEAGADVYVPILDAGRTLPWLDISSPTFNQVDPPVASGETPISIRGNMPNGILGDLRDNCTMVLYFQDSDDVVHICDSCDVTTYYDDWPGPGANPHPYPQPNVHEELVFNPLAISGMVEGLGQLFVAYEFSTTPAPPPVMSHPIPMEVEFPGWEYFTLHNPTACAATPGDLAIGVTDDGRLIAGWMDRVNGNYSVRMSIEDLMNPYTFSTGVVDYVTMGGPDTFTDFSVTRFTDPANPSQSVVGLVYQKDYYYDPANSIVYHWPGGMLTADYTADTYIEGYGNSSVRTMECPGLPPFEPAILNRYDHGLLPKTCGLAIHTTGSGWDNYDLGAWNDPMDPEMNLMRQILSTEYDVYRSITEMWPDGTYLGAQRVYYGKLSPYTTPPSKILDVVPIWDDGMGGIDGYQKCIGMAMAPNVYNSVDTACDPYVFITGGWYYDNPDRSTIYVAKEGPAGFETELISDCPYDPVLYPDNGVYLHGWLGRAIWLPDRATPAFVYRSGRVDDGYALMMATYVNNQWVNEVIAARTQTYDDIALTYRDGKVHVLFEYHHPSDGKNPQWNEMVVFVEP